MAIRKSAPGGRKALRLPHPAVVGAAETAPTIGMENLHSILVQIVALSKRLRRLKKMTLKYDVPTSLKTIPG